MQKLDFNEDWYAAPQQNPRAQQSISIPHDAMIREPRSEQSRGGGNIGWFEAGDYVYTKSFHIPPEYAGKDVIFEFEGVYRNAQVFINGEKAAYRPYGYTNFYVDANPYLRYGQQNRIEVFAYNADQPNSRWYSGTGIYRPVWMYLGNKEHILLNGVKIKTLRIHPAVIQVQIRTTGAGQLAVELLREGKTAAKVTAYTQGEATLEIPVEDAMLWSPEDPNLYTCKVTFGGDEAEETFGIRTIGWDRSKGFTINDKRVIIRGACIHHDNGVLGACAFPEAEERKVRIHKENGYNALRSAHNPCSKALLDACDRLGMLMMDEYLDVWYIHKTQYDYADYMADWWQRDLKDMVDKDYNHPSVVLYSTGNEVAETAQKKGIALTGEMTEYLHTLDATRPVTCGINIFFNFLSSIGFGVYSDEKAKKEAEKSRENKQTKKKPVGSEFYNTLAGILGDRTMKIGATLYPCDVKTRDAFANMDIAGYNYGILRYLKDLRKYPNRLILGSETFCKDAYEFWEMAKKHVGIVGDFVWAGMDYMGEAGIGSWEYEDYAPENAPQWGWLSAGSGRINLIGRPNGEAAYTKVAFECSNKPVIAVKPVYQTGKHSPSAWKMTDAMESWSWRGCSGYRAEVEVYARAAEVELLINERKVGRAKLKNSCRAVFRTQYEDGVIKAITYDAEGIQTGSTYLQTAGTETNIRVIPELPEGKARAKRLVFLLLQYTDDQGILQPMKKGCLQVEVIGGTLLGLGNACPYNLNAFRGSQTDTYYGEALAVVRAGEEDRIQITVSDGERMTRMEIPVEAAAGKGEEGC